jgi:hypothetical protein
MSGSYDPNDYAKYQAFLKSSDHADSVDTTGAMNPNIAKAAQPLINTGQMTQDQIAARSMEGVDKSGNLGGAGALQQQTQALGGQSDPGMQSAIASRQQKLYETHLNELGNVAKFNAPGIQAKQAQAALQGMASYEDLKTQAANTQMVKRQNDQAQRNAILNSVLQLGGTAAGFAIGGPPGAALGGAIGGGVAGLAEGGTAGLKPQNLDSGGKNSANLF